MGKKISQITSEESTSISSTDLFEGEEAGGTSFKTQFSVIKSTLENSLSLTESRLSLSDVTTANSSTTAHGLMIKAVAPSSGIRKIPAIDNGETVWKATDLLDNTNPAAIGTAAPGTSLLAARRDHVHAMPSTLRGRFFLPWGVFGSVGYMSTTSDPYGATIDRAMTAINFAVSGIVLTTNNGSNYWRVYVSYVGSTAFSCEVNTSAKSAGAWWQLSTASFTGSLDANTIGIFVEVAKVGSPGNILLFGPLLEVEIS